MNGPRTALATAWLVAMGWVAYRDVAIDHQPPQPRTIIKGSALYALLGIAQPLIGDQIAAALGWGLLAATIIRDTSRKGGAPPPGPAPDEGEGSAGGTGGVPNAGAPPVQTTSYLPAAGLRRRAA